MEYSARDWGLERVTFFLQPNTGKETRKGPKKETFAGNRQLRGFVQEKEDEKNVMLLN